MPLSSTVQQYIDNAAGLFGVSPRYLSAVAQMESGGDIMAQSSSGASGLFQFMPNTANEYGLSDPFDPQENANAAARLTSSNASFLSNALGRPATDSELYLAHQQGASGALALLTRGSDNAASIVGPLAVTGNAGTTSMTASDFVAMINKRFAASGGDVSATGTATGDPNAASSGTGIFSNISHLFVQGVIVILGFIFVAVGLYMFARRPDDSIKVNLNVSGLPDAKNVEVPKVVPDVEVPKAEFPAKAKGPSIVPEVAGKEHKRSMAARKGHETRKKKPRIATVGGKKYVKKREKSTVTHKSSDDVISAHMLAQSKAPPK